MIYLSAEYVISAIEQLAPVHAFLGITFLACKKEQLPVDDPINFPMDSKTREFMDENHRICPFSQYYFQPYKTVSEKYWVADKYPSSGLQSINTRTFASAFIHKKNTQEWCWASNYVERISQIAISHDKRRIPLPAIAVWVYKYCKWKDTNTIDDVIMKFLKDYHITQTEKMSLFSPDDSFPKVPVFQGEPISWNQLANSLSAPPDDKPDQEGTLSKLELINVGPCDHIEITMAPRLNIFTGDNGLGKTFIMDCAWWVLTNTWTGNQARPKYAEGSKKTSICYSISGKSKKSQSQTVLYDNKNFSWKRPMNTDTIPGLIIYALVDGSYAIWDPSKTTNHPSAVNVFSRQQVWNGQVSDGQGSQIEGLIRDWVNWQNKPDKHPFEVFKNVLKEMSPPDIGVLEPGEPIRIPNDSREIPTIVFPYGTVPITNSSAGVGRIITLAYLIVWAWNEHKENCRLRNMTPDSRIVVMVDELEAHLHPKWQRTILPALINIRHFLSNELEVQFIIATHSPLVLASIEPFFNCENDSLFQIKLDTDNTDAILLKEDFIKYGQINSWLTSPIFNMGQARSKEAESVINEAKNLQLDDAPSDEDVKRIHGKLIDNLSQTDPFWPRWVYFAEQHGVNI